MASDRPLAVFLRCPSLIDFNSVNWRVCVHNSHSARIPTLIDVEQHLAQQRAQCRCIQSCTLLTCAEKSRTSDQWSAHRWNRPPAILHELLLAFICSDLLRDCHVYFEMMGSDTPPQHSSVETRRARGVLWKIQHGWLDKHLEGRWVWWLTGAHRSPGFLNIHTPCVLYSSSSIPATSVHTWVLIYDHLLTLRIYFYLLPNVPCSNGEVFLLRPGRY